VRNQKTQNERELLSAPRKIVTECREKISKENTSDIKCAKKEKI
jgi:hypothetical protein